MDAAQELAGLEEEMQDRTGSYWQGPDASAKQARAFELYEAQESGTSAPARSGGRDARIAEIETAMAQRDGPYWKDGGRLQDEYRALLEAEDGGPHAEPGMVELQQAVTGIDDAMGGLSETLQGHLLNTYDDSEAPSSPAGTDDVEAFGATRHGKLLSKVWGSDTARHLGVALARIGRIERGMSAADLSEWRDFFFNRITTKERAVLVGYVAQQP